LSHCGQVKQKRTVLVIGQHLRAHRHLNDKIIPISAVAITAHPLNAAHSLKMLRIAKVDECVQPGHCLNNDITTLAAITAVGAAILHIFLPSKADRARATCAGTDKNLSLVKKMHMLAFRGECWFWPVLGSIPKLVTLNLVQGPSCVSTLRAKLANGC
jgi:hypothetical protein